MENHNQSNSNENSILKKNPKLYLVLLITVALIILFIFYLIEKILFIILTTITFTKLIAFPLQIILHILFIRYLIIQVAFAGQNIVVSSSMLYNLGKNQATPILKAIKALHDSLSILNDVRGLIVSIKELTEMKKNIGVIQSIINYVLDTFSKMKSKFNTLTIEQQMLYDNIYRMNEAIINGNVISFVNNTIDTIKKYNQESLADIPEQERDKIISELSGKNVNTQQILAICHTLMEILIDFIGESYPWYSCRYIRNFFCNRLFASIEQIHCELSNYYNFEEKTLITKDKCKLEYIIIKKNINTPKKKLMIICGPNGVPYQIFSRNFRFENYLESNMDILCWNYRGYGFSKGTPSYSKLRSDVLELFDEVKKNNNYERYAVHGISIGGIPCCHLASHRKEIELLICDRNFGRIDNIVQSFPYGKLLFKLYKLLLFQSTDNVENYLNVKCYKIIMNDPKDTIVLDSCSLKTLISMKLCENYFDCNHEDNSNFNSSMIGSYSSHNNELESLSSKKIISSSQNIQMTTLNDKITTNYNINDNNSKILIKKTALDKIFNSVEEKNKFVNILINISKIINNDKLEINSNNSDSGNIITNLIKKFKNKNLQYANLKEEELQNTSGIFDFVKNHMTDIFDSIESAGDTLFTLLSIKRDYTKEVYIDNFFNSMFIWGCKPSQNNDENNLHSVKNIQKIFSDCMKLFEEFWNSSEIISYKGLTLMREIDSLYRYFIIIQNNLKNVGFNTKDGFIKLINEELIDDDNNDNTYEKCLKRFNRGNFVPLHCGHNGALNSEEYELFERFLNKSSFYSDKSEKLTNNETIKTDEETDDINTCTVESDKI
jgi:hypothetical protein